MSWVQWDGKLLPLLTRQVPSLCFKKSWLSHGRGPEFHNCLRKHADRLRPALAARFQPGVYQRACGKRSESALRRDLPQTELGACGPPFLSHSSSFCPPRFRPYALARVISFPARSSFLVFPKAHGQRVNIYEATGWVVLWFVLFCFLKLLWKSKVACC